MANGVAAGALAAAPNRGLGLALVPNAGVEALLPKNEVVPKPNDAPTAPPHNDHTKDIDHETLQKTTSTVKGPQFQSHNVCRVTCVDAKKYFR